MVACAPLLDEYPPPKENSPVLVSSTSIFRSISLVLKGLSISLNYNKKFFRDGSLVPDESLNFLIKFIPFAEIRGSANTVLKERKN